MHAIHEMVLVNDMLYGRESEKTSLLTSSFKLFYGTKWR